MKLDFRTEIFKEDDQYVALAPELNVSSFGDTPEEAKLALKEAVELFLEECKRMGTLEEVLIEAGFKLEKKSWYSSDPRESQEKDILSYLKKLNEAKFDHVQFS